MSVAFSHYQSRIFRVMPMGAARTAPLRIHLRGFPTLAENARGIAVHICTEHRVASALILYPVEKVAVVIGIAVALRILGHAVHAQKVRSTSVVRIMATSHEAIVKGDGPNRT